MVRFGILGFGLHAARRLMPGFHGSTQCQVAGLWRRDTAKAAENCRVFHIDRAFATLEELCASPDLDAIFVASPDALHMEHVLLALSAGKPVLCEKPLAMNAAQVEAMLEAARKAGVFFGVAQNFRYNRSLQLAQRWIAEGRIGRPLLASVQFCYNAGAHPRTWIRDPSLACGGPIGDVGVHCLDAMRFLLGDEALSLTAFAARNERSGAVEALGLLSLEFSRGAFGSIGVASFAAYRTYFEVVGEAGLLTAENGLSVDQEVEVVLRSGGAVVAAERVSNADAYSRMLDSFADELAGRGRYLAPGEDGLRNQRLLDAAYASWRSGQRQTPPPG